MRLFSIILAVIICQPYLLQAQQTAVEEIITRDKVTQVISALSADSMQGREAFTPGIEKAAEYISGKFGQFRLDTLEGLNSYHQRFPIYRIQPGEVEISINGNRISEDQGNYVIFSRHKEVNWGQLEEIKTVERVTSDQNLRNRYGPIRQMNKDLIVLVDTAHRSTFDQLVRFFNRPTRTLELGSGPTQVFLLTTEDSIKSGSLSIEQRVEKQVASNIVGKITGSSLKDEYVIFSAHYDHIGIREPVKGDSIANGADDNASGTTAVISLAEYYKRTAPPERTILFVAFTAEELGLLGSSYFSNQIDPERVTAMINLEMIGKPSQFGPRSAYLTGYDRSTLGKILKNNLTDTPYSLHPDPYPEQNLFYRSDNASLARKGVPAHSISSVQIDQDSYYHTVDDELSTLDLDHLTDMIRAIALSAREIVEGKATPNRIESN